MLMQYIVFDLEMNQDFTSIQENAKQLSKFPFEIIQIGAIKMNSSFHTLATFNRYVNPTIYEKISPFVTKLTGISTLQLQQEEYFNKVFEAFLLFIGNTETIFVTWGMSDIKQLYCNAAFHHLNVSALTCQYINLQPYASLHFGFSVNKLLRLQFTIEALKIPITVPFHNAIHDAHYTSEIFKKIYHSFMQPQTYNPDTIISKERPPKKVIDYDKLYAQFEKMYNRALTDEERQIIRLAYHMGKTKQFLSILKNI